MYGIKATIECLWNIANISFSGFGISFTLFDVFCTGLILSVIGSFIGKIIFFLSNRR